MTPRLRLREHFGAMIWRFVRFVRKVPVLVLREPQGGNTRAILCAIGADKPSSWLFFWQGLLVARRYRQQASSRRRCSGSASSGGLAISSLPLGVKSARFLSG